MKIGIGVISYNRPAHLKLCNEMIWKHTPGLSDGHPHYWVVDDSHERMGIAFRSNEILKHFKERNCDYIFIFNDDCFPIRDGWAEWFIQAHKASSQHHFLYLKETPTIKKIAPIPFIEGVERGFGAIEMNSYNNCAGCFMFLTKEVIKRVGGFHPGYGLYGYEHAGYSKRIHAAGLTPMGEYLCPAGAGDYIYSLDLDNHLPFNKQVKHAPSIKPQEALESIEKNRKVFEEDIKTIYQPL